MYIQLRCVPNIHTEDNLLTFAVGIMHSKVQKLGDKILQNMKLKNVTLHLQSQKIWVAANCKLKKIAFQVLIQFTFLITTQFGHTVIVPDPGKGVCADPVNGGAILGKGGPDPKGGNKERQLSPDKGREKT
jgi:hypothetical protein